MRLPNSSTDANNRTDDKNGLVVIVVDRKAHTRHCDPARNIMVVIIIMSIIDGQVR